MAAVAGATTGILILGERYQRRWMPRVEFLPDSGVCRWAAVRKQVYVAAGVLGLCLSILTGLLALGDRIS